MDFEAFESDVWESVNKSLYRDQVSAYCYGDDVSGLVYTVGETWQGALYGAEENGYGHRAVYLFETEQEQVAWFNAVTGDLIGTY